MNSRWSTIIRMRLNCARAADPWQLFDRNDCSDNKRTGKRRKFIPEESVVQEVQSDEDISMKTLKYKQTTRLPCQVI